MLELCERLGVGMVLDVHHARVTKDENYEVEAKKKEKALKKIVDTIDIKNIK